MGLAHEHYPLQPEDDPAFSYTHFTRYSLYVFGEGQTRLFLNQPQEVQDRFTYVAQNILHPQSEPLMHVDLAYYQATASVMLDALELSCSALQAAATLAKQNNSRLYINKIFLTYQEMRKKWGKEQTVVELEELFHSSR